MKTKIYIPLFSKLLAFCLFVVVFTTSVNANNFGLSSRLENKSSESKLNSAEENLARITASIENLIKFSIPSITEATELECVVSETKTSNTELNLDLAEKNLDEITATIENTVKFSKPIINEESAE